MLTLSKVSSLQDIVLKFSTKKFFRIGSSFVEFPTKEEEEEEAFFIFPQGGFGAGHGVIQLLLQF